MTKTQAKRILLGQLSNYLRREIPIDGVTTDEDMAIFEAASNDLIIEFERRSDNAVYEPRWDSK